MATAGQPGQFALIKIGSGAQTLTGNNSASDIRTNVQGGILSVPSLNSLGSGFLAAQLGGTFQYTGTGTETKTGRLYWNNGSGTFDITSPTGNAIFNVTLGDFGSGGGAFTKTFTSFRGSALA